jgi:hypothetical protein
MRTGADDDGQSATSTVLREAERNASTQRQMPMNGGDEQQKLLLPPTETCDRIPDNTQQYLSILQTSVDRGSSAASSTPSPQRLAKDEPSKRSLDKLENAMQSLTALMKRHAPPKGGQQ